MTGGPAHEVPPGWVVAPLGDLVDVLDSQRVPLNADQRRERPGSVPYYGATGRVGFVDRPIFDEPLVLLGEDGAPFLDQDKPKAYLVDGPCWVNNHAHVLRPYINRRYLKFYLDQFDYRGYANGTTRLKLTKSALLSLPVRVPPESEQERIADALEAPLSNLEQVLGDLDKLESRISGLAEAVTLAGVIGRLTECAPASVSAEQSLGALLGEIARPQTLDLPALPLGWAWATLGSISDVSGGITKDSKKQDGADLVEVPYLRVANVQRGRLDLREVARIRVPESKANALRLESGDVLFNEGGDRDKLGRGWVWNAEIENCIHQNHVFRARILSGVLDPRLLSWHGNTFGRRWFEAAGKQTTNLASLSMTNLKQLPVPIPPLEMQPTIVAAIEAHLSSTQGAREAVAVLREKVRGLRRGLLDAAVAGRLVEPDRRDVGAEILVKEISAARAERVTVVPGKRRALRLPRRHEEIA